MNSERMVCIIAIGAILNQIEDPSFRREVKHKLWRHTYVSRFRGREPLTTMAINAQPLIALYPMSDRWWEKTLS